MEVTLKDIAKEARVSISTVSRVLNQNSGALNETQKRILATAKSMGYSDKKVIAMSHVDRLSCTLGCIFTSEHESIVSPFFSELHKGIQMEAKRLSSFMDIQLITTSVNGADSRGLTKKTNLTAPSSSAGRRKRRLTQSGRRFPTASTQASIRFPASTM